MPWEPVLSFRKGCTSFQRKAMPKNIQTTTQLHSSHTASSIMLSPPSHAWTWTVNFHMFKLDFKKGRNHRSNCQHPLDHWKSKRVPEKHLLYWLRQNLRLCGSQQTGKFFKRWEYQTTLPASWETCMQVKKQQLKLDMEQQTGSKLGKEYIKAVYCHPAYLTYM